MTKEFENSAAPHVPSHSGFASPTTDPKKKSVPREPNVPLHHIGVEKLNSASRAVTLQLHRLFEKRGNGITAAEREVSGFVRAKPENSSLLFDFAMVALQVATAGIGAAVAHRVAPIIKNMLSKPMGASGPASFVVVPPSDTVMAFFSEAIEAGVQTAGGHAISKLEGDPARPGSFDATAEFFRIERDALVDDYTDRAIAVSDKISETYLPSFEAAPYADMPPAATAIIAGLRETATALASLHETTSQIQAEATVKSWVKYVESTGRHSTLNDLRTLEKPSDGVIDLTFSAMQANAASSVTVTNARLNGVKKAVVKRFLDIPLNETGLTVRASCRFSPEQGVIVVRESDGSIRYTDTPREVASWLAQKAGVRSRPQDEDRARGATILVDELTRKSLKQHLVGNLDKVIGYDMDNVTSFVRNDSDE